MPIGRIGDAAGQQAKIILYGASGAGKTHLSSQLDHALILDFENGRLSMPPEVGLLSREDDPTAPVTPKEINEAFESNPEQVPSICIQCSSTHQIGHVLTCLRNPKMRDRFNAIVIDSVTTLTEIVEDDVLRRYPTLVRSIVSSDGDRKGLLTQEGWLNVIETVRRALVCFRDVPAHVVFTMHEETTELDDGRAFTRPKLRGKTLLPTFQAMVDFGFRIEIHAAKEGDNVSVRRRLRTQPDQNVWAKTRNYGGKLLQPFELADLRAVINKIAVGEKKDG